MRHALIATWLGVVLGGSLVLLLIRFCEAIGRPVDALTLALVAWNTLVPAVVLIEWSATAERFISARHLYAALLATAVAWVLACVPYQTLFALLALFGLLDVLLVALPCCSPVMHLDRITKQRERQGERQMPGVTYVDPSANGLFLGLGDFLVFSLFVSHASSGGAAPAAAVGVGLLAGLTVTMMRVALAWPRGALEPALPIAIVASALLFAAERFAVGPLADALAEAGVWT